MKVTELAEKYAPHAVEIRRTIHQNPELGNKEFNTSALIRKELASYGIEVQELPMETAVTAVIRGGKPGKTVGLREDIDALPMKEVTGLPFASQCDRAHACGHDIHNSALLLTARILQDMREELCGNVRLIWQPAEEVITGARDIIKAGVMELEPKCDVVLGFHCSPEFDAGTIGVRKGPANASTDAISITVRGKGGHGAHPDKCIDPIAASAYMLTQLQTLASRENLAVEPMVLTFGMIHGGTAMNVIPSEVKLDGTLRTFSVTGRKLMQDAIRRCAEHSCAAMRATAEVTIVEGCACVINDEDVIDRVIAAAGETIGSGNINRIPYPSTGSDDIAEFGAFAPMAQFRVGTGNENPATRLGLHNPGNIFDEKAITVGAEVLAQFTADYLKQ